MQQSSNGCRYSNSKTTLAFNDFRHGRKTWQTIVKTIRVAVSKGEVNRLRAVRGTDKKPAADKVSRAARVESRVFRAAREAAWAKKVVSRATAASSAVTEVSSIER